MKKIIFGKWPKTTASDSIAIPASREGIAVEGEWYTGTDGKQYVLANHRFFTVEPLEWEIVEEGFDYLVLISKNVIANMSFDEAKSDYQKSYIRKWLNTYFYQHAFSDDERQSLLFSHLDNSPASTEVLTNTFCCPDTVDAVYLMSYDEAYRKWNLTDVDRTKTATEYAKATGAYVAEENGCTFYWLRSPRDDYDFHALTVGYSGLLNYGTVLKTPGGVVPVIKIQKAKCNK